MFSVTGLVAAVNGALSSDTTKLAPLSFASKANIATRLFTVPLGPEVMVVCGGVASTSHVKLAGAASTFPAPSMARTAKVWEASVRPLSTSGLVADV
jgi:hypothetical protein